MSHPQVLKFYQIPLRTVTVNYPAQTRKLKSLLFYQRDFLKGLPTTTAICLCSCYKLRSCYLCLNVNLGIHILILLESVANNTIFQAPCPLLGHDDTVQELLCAQQSRFKPWQYLTIWCNLQFLQQELLWLCLRFYEVPGNGLYFKRLLGTGCVHKLDANTFQRTTKWIPCHQYGYSKSPLLNVNRRNGFKLECDWLRIQWKFVNQVVFNEDRKLFCPSLQQERWLKR